MIGHGGSAFVIDQAGHMRQEPDFDTSPATQATKSSFAAELTDAARQQKFEATRRRILDEAGAKQLLPV
jgi:hypothetical protein